MSSENEPMTVHEWLLIGLRNNWCSKPACYLHESAGITQEDDRCLTIVRLYLTGEPF